MSKERLEEVMDLEVVATVSEEVMMTDLDRILEMMATTAEAGFKFFNAA